MWRTIDFSPLFISVKTGIAATIIAFFIGVFCAKKIVGMKGRVKALLDAILTLPLVLPPTVAGFFLLLLFSKRRPLGMFLYKTFGISIVQTWAACVIASTVVAFPLMYKNARAAFEQIDPNIINAGRTLGLSERKIFRKIVIPLARPGLVSGAMLTFARAMGEYGATSMLAGNIPGKTGTISQKIAMVMQDGDYEAAGMWSVIVIIISLLIIVAINVIYDQSSKVR